MRTTKEVKDYVNNVVSSREITFIEEHRPRSNSTGPQELHTQRMDGQEKCDLTGIQIVVCRPHNSGRNSHEGRLNLSSR
ncbi:hypothetical protein P5673_001661 [Acropora cervicornis]|uniref:Uncharacterized protein n=1 Tax=Acropora cervicornis TaxID=6130 RepID=A0AAD9R436_ACRCE|nr:hypothetical protein P5673_001661 [Acropora cervicornis]